MVFKADKEKERKNLQDKEESEENRGIRRGEVGTR